MKKPTLGEIEAQCAKVGLPKRTKRVVRAKMKIYEDGTASFHVVGYDFRWADMPIAVNGYLFAPVRNKDG